MGLVPNLPKIQVSRLKNQFSEACIASFTVSQLMVKMVGANINKKLLDWAQIRLKIVFILIEEDGNGPIS